MSIAYRYTKDINLSQDFLQESFILIFKKLNQFDVSRGNFESWSSKILINKILEYKRKKQEVYFEDYTDLYIAPVNNPVIDKMSVDEIKKQIKALPEIYRDILQLYYFEEFSHAEIANLLKIEASSSRSRLTRAKQLLTAQWQQLQNHQS